MGVGPQYGGYVVSHRDNKQCTRGLLRSMGEIQMPVLCVVITESVVKYDTKLDGQQSCRYMYWQPYVLMVAYGAD